VLKLGVGVLSGSLGVVSEGIHSLLDLVSATLAYFTVREALKPADEEHPFGHGKLETLSSLFEALLLVTAAIWIVLEAVGHVRHPQEIRHSGIAIATIAVSLAVSFFVYRQNRVAAELTESSAIHVNALHFLADAITSIGVIIGLLLLRVTGWLLIDQIVAFAVAGYILWISWRQVRNAVKELSDVQLPDAEIARIREVLGRERIDMIETHDLRTRKSGAQRHIDFHLVVCGETSVQKSHSLCDQIEDQLHEAFPTASINIHVEPCSHENIKCLETCPHRAGGRR
jgi:cation diffusion facilitator family transporter